MKKSELKEVIKTVLIRKLNEVADVVDMKGNKVKPEQYGLVIDKNSDDPIVQVVGYGKMKYSNLKSAIEQTVDVVKKEIKAKNYDNALHYTDPKGILILMMKAAQEIEGELADGVNEVMGQSISPDAVADALSSSTQNNPADQKKVMDLEKQKNDLQSKLDITKGQMSKALTPYQRKIKQDEEKLGRINQDLQRLQRKTHE